MPQAKYIIDTIQDICNEVHQNCFRKLDLNFYQNEAQVEFARGKLLLARQIVRLRFPGWRTYDTTLRLLSRKANEFSDEESQIAYLVNDAKPSMKQQDVYKLRDEIRQRFGTQYHTLLQKVMVGNARMIIEDDKGRQTELRPFIGG